jgi:hypothetical protein
MSMVNKVTFDTHREQYFKLAADRGWKILGWPVDKDDVALQSAFKADLFKHVKKSASLARWKIQLPVQKRVGRVLKGRQ